MGRLNEVIWNKKPRPMVAHRAGHGEEVREVNEHKGQTGQHGFSLKDYKKALKGAGPKLTYNIIQRAIDEKKFSFEEIKELVDYAYPG